MENLGAGVDIVIEDGQKKTCFCLNKMMTIPHIPYGWIPGSRWKFLSSKMPTLPTNSCVSQVSCRSMHWHDSTKGKFELCIKLSNDGGILECKDSCGPTLNSSFVSSKSVASNVFRNASTLKSICPGPWQYRIITKKEITGGYREKSDNELIRH